MQALEMPQVIVGAVNVGWSQAVSLNQLLAEIGSLCGGLPAVDYRSARPGDIRHSRADNRRLQDCYRLPPATAMREGLRRLLNQG
ncbi:hypothetical protein D3C86_2119060 [compost metagenome]